MSAAAVLEQAQLTVFPGQEAEFEAAFGKARAVISARPGFRRVSLSRGVEEPASYLLLVEWDTLEDHTVGFVTSPEFQVWRGLMGPFYAAPAVVRHFTPVTDPPA